MLFALGDAFLLQGGESGAQTLALLTGPVNLGVTVVLRRPPLLDEGLTFAGRCRLLSLQARRHLLIGHFQAPVACLQRLALLGEIRHLRGLLVNQSLEIVQPRRLGDFGLLRLPERLLLACLVLFPRRSLLVEVGAIGDQLGALTSHLDPYGAALSDHRDLKTVRDHYLADVDAFANPAGKLMG